MKLNEFVDNGDFLSVVKTALTIYPDPPDTLKALANSIKAVAEVELETTSVAV